MYIGIDLGTSGVKTVLINEGGKVVTSVTRPLSVSMPYPLWSEQDPNDWWEATCDSLDELSREVDLTEVKSIGLSGQMHGATLLDNEGNVLRPAILWNDGRSSEECEDLGKLVPDSSIRTGNLIMAGFTAPKILWVKKNEPEIFSKINKVLLPKDFLRYQLSGEFGTDMSDAAGTVWLNTESRCWDEELLSACGLSADNMPILYEGSSVTGNLKESLQRRWGMHNVVLAGGAGDNAAGAIGCGIYESGHAMLSLGTSGVYFAVTDRFTVNTAQAVHSFCHAIPNRWHLMSVMLSASSCLDWYAKQSGYIDVGHMIDDVQSHTSHLDTQTPVFLPYLTGERTPHNNPSAKAAFFGISASTERVHMARAVIEGVSMALADGIDAVHQSGIAATSISLIGGGARSTFWRQLLSDISGYELEYREGGDVGPALGAARLAQLAANPSLDISDVCFKPTLEETYVPNSEVHVDYLSKRQKFRELYYAVEPFFS
ncbi:MULTISPECIES: xylulokinase [unclassified Alteromonas]|uniref:xylulokinase n=1 Tax=unclassified Alteromonas TaxID=2614992 RepID=UPI000509BF26|nr:MULTISPECIES: xylulokinase [unclassified Alteromonas]